MQRVRRFEGFDFWLLGAIIVIVGFGVLMVYSASSYVAQANFGNAFFYVYKQLLGGALGLVALFFFAFFDYRRFAKLRWIVLVVSIAVLVIVLIPGIGVAKYGARRWIELPFFTIQASEISKFGYIIFASCYMAKNYQKMQTFKGMLPLLGLGGLMCLLIILEPNMSITIVVVLLMLTMLFLGGAKIKHFFILAVPLLALVPLLIVLEPYRLKRLMAFLNPWENPLEEGFQLIQSFYALGSGGLFGLGLFNSRQKYLFLPFAESDFIFSIIAEELGLVGSLLVMGLFLFVTIRCIHIAMSAPDRLGAYLASGIAALIAIQTLVNIAVVTGSIPPTGLPLPFVSSGSSSLIVFMGGIGIVQNIARSRASVKDE